MPFYVAAPTSTIDLALPDGDAIPIEERGAEEVLEVFGGEGVLSTYGMTECPIISLTTTRDPHDKRAHTEGRPNGTEIRVVRFDGSLAGPGEEGEIRVNGPQRTRGFVDARLDAEVIDDTVGALLKYQDDIERIRGSEAGRILEEVRAELAVSGAAE